MDLIDRPTSPLAVTVLGSSGPLTASERVSSGYLVWVDGDPALLVDAGGGVFERLGRLEVDVSALSAVALTHLHIDHTGGLAPVVFAMWMRSRREPLRVVGPAGDGDQPGCTELARLLFGEHGAWRYLHSFEGFGIDAEDLPSDPEHPHVTELAPVAGATLRTAAVPHGMMPAVAYRIDHAGRSLVISGDVARPSSGIIDLARGADLLVHDQAVPDDESPHAHLHTTPAQTGTVAAEATVDRLLLSHLMPEAREQIEAVTREVRTTFPGTVEVAHDLMSAAV